MKISSFNINKFCGAYSAPFGGYRNPRNLDFKSKVKDLVEKQLQQSDDIIFLQEFLDNNYIEVENLFEKEKYKILSTSADLKSYKSSVVAISKKDSNWKLMSNKQKEKINCNENYPNKILEVCYSSGANNLNVLGFHNTDNNIKKFVNDCFQNASKDIILGDFNDTEWLKELLEIKNFKAIVASNEITFKPSQSMIDQIFIKSSLEELVKNYEVIETYSSDHNIISVELKLNNAAN